MSYYALNHFVAELGAVLQPDGSTVSLPGLADRLPAGDHTSLVISLGRDFEVVSARNEAGSVVLARGQQGTVARKWPRGARVEWKLTVADICQAIACGQCGADFPLAQPPKPCNDPGCCVAVGVSVPAVPAPKAGERWQLAIPLTGSPDFEFGDTAGLPRWLEADLVGDALILSGTPDAEAPARLVAVEIRNACSAKTALVSLPAVAAADPEV